MNLINRDTVKAVATVVAVSTWPHPQFCPSVRKGSSVHVHTYIKVHRNYGRLRQSMIIITFFKHQWRPTSIGYSSQSLYHIVHHNESV